MRTLIQPCNHPVEDEVEYVLENQVDKEPNYQQGGNDMQPKASQVLPTQTSEYVTIDDLRKFLEANRGYMNDIEFRPPYPSGQQRSHTPRDISPHSFFYTWIYLVFEGNYRFITDCIG